MMFNPLSAVIEGFLEYLRQSYYATYSNLEPDYPGIITFVGRLALENISGSDALYHDTFHTMSATLVGQEIIRGKHIREGGVSPKDWLSFIVSMLCHDIGYVRGVCRGDQRGRYVASESGELVELPEGATDASLTPYHVDRGKIFIRERFGSTGWFDIGIVEKNMEFTRFPVPDGRDGKGTADFPGLVRAADLIGQLADLDYMRKITALYYEFEETGVNKKLGYRSAADLRAGYPKFYWHGVHPYIKDAIRYLQVTQNGKQWIANLYSHVFAVEHDAPTLGPEAQDG